MTTKPSYSALDRFVHRMAFASTGLQKAIADIEDRLYAKAFSETPLTRPVFLTSLPRAGTTLFLNVLYNTGAFATHTYREMPFVMIPWLWHTITRPFYKEGSTFERAHGDGMMIDYDSVEAFEEIVWKAFWPKHYLVDRIKPWVADAVDPDEAFPEFFSRHMQKVIALQLEKASSPGQSFRYLSKNNANIARLPLLARLYPDALFLVPFRNPVNHVASLMRQHERFLQIHVTDAFAMRYMRDIGHYEFGANLKPINFKGWLDADYPEDVTRSAFWFAYWCAAYEALLVDAPENLILVSYDACCENPAPVLSALGQALELEAPQTLTDQVDRFRPPKKYGAEAPTVDAPLKTRVEACYAELSQRSINP